MHSGYKKQLINQFLNDNPSPQKDVNTSKRSPQVLDKEKHRNDMKVYKADSIVNELTNQLFKGIKKQFLKEKGKRIKKLANGTDNKENLLNHSKLQSIAEKPQSSQATKAPLTKQSIKARKVADKSKPKRAKIGDYVKVRFGETWNVKPNEDAKTDRVEKLHKRTVASNISNDKEDNRRKQIG